MGPFDDTGSVQNGAALAPPTAFHQLARVLSRSISNGAVWHERLAGVCRRIKSFELPLRYRVRATERGRFRRRDTTDRRLRVIPN
jgi:hypothetical protein